MKAAPLFTVIIPCKDRAQYLEYTLKTCSMQQYEPFEVIVSDDNSSDHTRDVLEEVMQKDPRVRCFFHGDGIGMRENFEFALRQVKPGFVIALGGDDGLMPEGIVGMWDVLRSTGLELLAWPAPVYTYPQVAGSAGQLAIYHKKGNRIIRSEEFLARQCRNLNYLSDIESPMFYVKGVTSTEIVDRVKKRSGDSRFYRCPTPDGYSGIVLAGEVEQYAFSSKPFSIYGLSPGSQGMAYLSNEEKAKRESERFFRFSSMTPMHKDLASQPYSPLITLMTLDFLLTARDLPGWPGKVLGIDYRRALMKAIRELSHGLYGGDRLCRELHILNRIAERHEMGEFFRDKIRRSSRYKEKKLFKGNGFNGNFFFIDTKAYGVNDIAQAAVAANVLYSVYSEMSLRAVLEAIVNSIRYRFHSRLKGGPFPSQTEWLEKTYE